MFDSTGVILVGHKGGLNGILDLPKSTLFSAKFYGLISTVSLGLATISQAVPAELIQRPIN